MFTGIVQQLGTVVALEPNDLGAVLRIDPRGWSHQPAAGESVAVNGCCLTVTNPPRGRDGALEFEVIRQTLAVTALGALGPGDQVNLEHAATPATLLGGHIVQGHIDGVGTVIDVVADRGEHRVRVNPPPPLMEFNIDKGSIAVDGVSLTLAAVGADWFEVALIPTTLRLTTLGQLRVGSLVNLETDCMVKTIVHQLRRLRESGALK